jgi:hypothetical protein
MISATALTQMLLDGDDGTAAPLDPPLVSRVLVLCA